MAVPRNPVAAGATVAIENTLAWNMVRLPLGHSATDPSPRGPETYFWLVIPTDTGGQLTIVHEGQGGQVTMVGHDGHKVLAGPSGHISIRMNAGSVGTFYVKAEGGDIRKVSCRFVQTGIAREGESEQDAPLIPWNFCYWAGSITFTDGTSNPLIPEIDKMLRKYAHTFGVDEKATIQWERDNHQIARGEGWFGHCHQIAAASILFALPTTRTIPVVKSTTEVATFTDEDLKFLSGEWYGNFGGKTVLFGIENFGTTPWPELLPTRSYTMLFKPSEQDLPPPEMQRRLERAILSFDPTLGDSDKATEMARRAFRNSTLPSAIKRGFGLAAAVFYQTLIDQILVKKNALISNLRATGAGNGPVEVWNHAIFWYEAAYEEILPSDVEDPSNIGYMNITLLLVANFDHGAPPSAGLPADVSARGVVNVHAARGRSRWSRQILNIVFDTSSGHIISQDHRNAWKRSQSGDGADELYAPEYLGVVNQVGLTQATASSSTDTDPLVNGNIMVDLDLVTEPLPLLNVRKRYRK